MATATHNLGATAPVSKVDATDWTRELWLEAFAMARRMIRDGGRYGLGARYVWCLDHLRRRFGASGWKIAQAAARGAFDLRAVSKAATGTREQLAREGMLTRAVRVEPAPRGGWSWAWSFDDFASPNTARSLRRLRAKRLREERRAVLAGLEAEERARALAVGWEMARDRVALDGCTLSGVPTAEGPEAGTFYEVTPAGLEALRAALAGAGR